MSQEFSNSLNIGAAKDMFLFPFIILCRWVRRHDFTEKERDEKLCYHSTDYRVISKPILKSNFKFKILFRIV